MTASSKAQDALVQAIHTNDHAGITQALQAGANLEAVTIVGFLEGQTPLEMALSKGHREAAQVLDVAGATWPTPERTEWLMRQSDPLQRMAQQLQAPTAKGVAGFDTERARLAALCAFVIAHQPALATSLGAMQREVAEWTPPTPPKTGWFRRLRR